MNIFIKIPLLFGKLFSYLFPPKVADLISRTYNKMITGYKSSSFGSVGWPINIGKGTRIMGGKSFRLGDNVTFGVDSVLETFCQYGHQRFNPIVKIGNNCSFGDYTHITCINSITIGDNLLTGRRVLISDNSHGESMIMTNKNEMGG